MVFRGSLSDSKTPQDSRIHLSILTDFSSSVVLMVSILPLISFIETFFHDLEDYSKYPGYKSLWYYTAFPTLWQGVGVGIAFRLLSIILYGLIVQQNPLYDRFFSLLMAN